MTVRPTATGHADPALEPLRTSRVALLTTYRRDGAGVGTPVGIQVTGDRAYFTTRSRTWKVRRLARDPRATVAPCNRRGRVTGEAVECVVHRLDDVDVSSFQARFWVLVYRLFYRDTPVRYELRPVQGASRSGDDDPDRMG
ncbi:PPOX class F420-dependent oxidoreductase [Actinopolymorpha alba]|uniref:PPOX class F420-dependent oxidoreductase n=1 Tax=Actinopolymorpha alba TaxID=533267 RepID=UPI00037F4FDA|nr:PPOX class F420-dependent oxidoreductase [Actinopolymorpha alba]